MTFETSARAITPRRTGAKRVTQIIALALTLAAGLAALFVPGYQTVTSDSEGNVLAKSTTTLEQLGPWVVVLVLIPVAVAATPFLVSRGMWQPATIVAAALLIIWGVVSAWTIGIYYVPAIVCLLASVFLTAHGRSASGVTQSRSP